ncbi:tail fiber domain-containing protein [Aequorivita sp. KMM 9714]|uniref:tail fiber domain-containing protein n=1 Tax=Aequorivita sp. KMM 9714 TaxID=2707173 RepID=UPI0013ECF899|nr:tail fiber domain-containing protein [Aequorivita sp. KMM 9714]NGX84159.1 hypothetical protein [Aequorivita sp. KMM 9714]
MRQIFTLNKIFLFCLLSFLSLTTFAQVGIGTTDPNGDALLEIDASTTPGGLLLPRVDLVATNNVAPLSAHVRGMAVYNKANTSGANGVTPGYYFNDGSQWVRIAASSDVSDDWKLIGNAGTVPGTNFIGTTDNQPLRVRTNDVERFEFTNNGRLRSFHNGGPGQPTYSWVDRSNTGMWSQADNVISFSTNGTEKFRIPNAEQVYAMGNGTAAAPFYSWSSDSDIGMYRIQNNTLGFSTNGNERVRFSGTEAAFNNEESNYNFRIGSSGRSNMFFINAANNRIGIQTSTPAFNFHMLNSGNVGENTSMATFVNSGTNAVALSSRNSGVNGYNAFEGVTDYNGTIYATSGVFGLAIANSGEGIGVRGASNSSNGYGVRGSIPTSGQWQGYGGLFLGGLGYANGLYNLSDERAKKNVIKISSALDNILKIEGVSYNYDMKKFNPNASEDPHTYYGFIAQNVKEYLPFAVAEKRVPFDDAYIKSQSASESKSELLNVVDYTALVPVLVEAIKEQQSIIDSQEARITKLEALVQQLINK